MSTQEATGGEVLAAVETVDVDQLPALRDASQAGVALAEQADRLRVQDAISAETAAALLGQVVAARRNAEAQRLDLTRPLNQVVKKINAAASRTMRPLQEVEATLKRKLLAYQREQQRLAELERVRLEAEAERRQAEEAERHREVEEVARIEREAAARATAAAQEAERQARDAEARRAREETDAITVKLRGATDEQLAKAATTGSTELARLALAEIEHRRGVREAARAAGAAREREAAARRAEEQARSAEVLPIAAPQATAPARLAGGGATVSTRKRWVYEVVDFAKVPDRFKALDRGAVQAAVREGQRDVPGLRIFQVDDASVAL